jgi:pSer/pThr/pTyr-binding forkhead associated (FHA) protein
MFRVTMTFNGKPVKKYTFEKDEIAIGRDATCDIVIENIGASRRHAVIEKTAEGYVLSDLQSHNGTFVNGEKIFHHRLGETDEFFIGKFAFQFESLEPVVQVVGEGPAQSAPAKQEMPDMTFRLDRKEIEKIIGLSARGTAPQLVQLSPEQNKGTILLEKSYHVLGADETCDLRTPGFLLPAKAGVILRTDQGYRLLSLSKKLRVNGKEIGDVALMDGDLIELKRYRYRFCQG